MFALVEETIHLAVDGLKARSPDVLAQLRHKDDEVDRRDVLIEEECLKILALHQPVAIDLRRVASVLKITVDLERVADLGVNIGERTAGIAKFPDLDIPSQMDEIASRALDMLHRAINAFVALDAAAARSVCADDDKVDRLNDEIIRGLTVRMAQSPENVEPCLHLFSVTRHLERVADHATNVAEDVVYMVEGEIIRHRSY